MIEIQISNFVRSQRNNAIVETIQRRNDQIRQTIQSAKIKTIRLQNYFWKRLTNRTIILKMKESVITAARKST